MPFGPNPVSISDQEFDRLYPEEIQTLSHMHWSSIAAIKTAIDLFSATLNPDAKILDVGSGVGKFCIYGSLISPFNFVGVEKRKKLVDISIEVAAKTKNNRVSFLCDDAVNLDWNSFDGIYMYNPFYEHKLPFHMGLHIDNEINYSEEKYSFYITKIHKKLSLLKPDTNIVVFNGYGGRFPKGYTEIFYKKINGGKMSLWRASREA